MSVADPPAHKKRSSFSLLLCARPFPGGTYGNRTDLTSADNCTKVGRDFWAPLGSPLPEGCGSGFYCPGYDDDDQNDPPGSKPLIMPTGGSTEVREVEIIMQDLALDMTCADFNYDAIVQTLAAQYGVDASLVSFDDPCVSASPRRGRKLESLYITVEILTPQPDQTGAASTTSAADILAAMSTMSATALASSIGAALGTVINVTTSAPTQTTEERTLTVVCKAGFWCTAGLVVPCDKGAYNNETGQTDARACKPCPPNSWTLTTSSTSIEDCVCNEGFYDAIAGSGVDCAQWSALCDWNLGKWPPLLPLHF